MQVLRLSLASATVAAVLALGAADVAARDWVVMERLGTVLRLSGDGWEEVERGSRFTDGAVIRTLQRGQLRLEADTDRISIGQDTVVELRSSPGSEATELIQHAGVVTLAVNSGGSSLRLLAPGLAVAPSAGSVVVQVLGNNAQVTASTGGQAVVTDRASGRSVAVSAGGAVTGGGGNGMGVGHAPSQAQGSSPTSSQPGSGARAEPEASRIAGGPGGDPGNKGGGNAGAGLGGNAGGNAGGGAGSGDGAEPGGAGGTSGAGGHNRPQASGGAGGGNAGRKAGGSGGGSSDAGNEYAHGGAASSDE